MPLLVQHHRGDAPTKLERVLPGRRHRRVLLEPQQQSFELGVQQQQRGLGDLHTAFLERPRVRRSQRVHEPDERLRPDSARTVPKIVQQLIHRFPGERDHPQELLLQLLQHRIRVRHHRLVGGVQRLLQPLQDHRLVLRLHQVDRLLPVRRVQIRTDSHLRVLGIIQKDARHQVQHVAVEVRRQRLKRPMRHTQVVVRPRQRVRDRDLGQQQLCRSIDVLWVAPERQGNCSREVRPRSPSVGVDHPCPLLQVGVRIRENPFQLRILLRVPSIPQEPHRLGELRLRARIRNELVIHLEVKVGNLHHGCLRRLGQPVRLVYRPGVGCCSKLRQLRRYRRCSVRDRISSGLGRWIRQPIGHLLQSSPPAAEEIDHRVERPLHHVIVDLRVMRLPQLVPAVRRDVGGLTLLLHRPGVRLHPSGQLRSELHLMTSLRLRELLRQRRHQLLRRPRHHQVIRTLLLRHLLPESGGHLLALVPECVHQLRLRPRSVFLSAQLELRTGTHADAHRHPVHRRHRDVLERGEVLMRQRLQERLHRFLSAFAEAVDQRRRKPALPTHQRLRRLVQIVRIDHTATGPSLRHHRPSTRPGEQQHLRRRRHLDTRSPGNRGSHVRRRIHRELTPRQRGVLRTGQPQRQVRRLVPGRQPGAPQHPGERGRGEHLHRIDRDLTQPGKRRDRVELALLIREDTVEIAAPLVERSALVRRQHPSLPEHNPAHRALVQLRADTGQLARCPRHSTAAEQRSRVDQTRPDIDTQ